MQLFYFKDQDNAGNALLVEDELGHCTRTLRKQVGDTLHLIDGKGNLFEGTLLSFDKKQAQVKIVKTLPSAAPRAFKLNLVVAPTKNIERIEWLLEKSIEMGLEAYTSILCDRSERKNLRVDRLEKIALSAVKQSLNIRMPEISELTDFSTFIKNAPSGKKLIAHCDNSSERFYLPNVLANLKESEDSELTILIGPEGDFTPKEVKMALAAGFEPISLGNMRLRTETAGLMVAAMVSIRNQQTLP